MIRANFQTKFHRTILASLLIVAAGCNSAGPVTPVRPSEPTTQTGTISEVRNPELVADMRTALVYLASDDLQGRGIGTKGLDTAADYIAARFTGAGLIPAPELASYFQTFDVTTDSAIDPATSLALADAPLKLHDSFRPLGFSAAKAFSGEIAFAGYGISSEQFHYDDYENLDVKGKIVVAMRYEPHDANGKSRFEPERYSNEATLNRKASVAAEHGAAALLLVTPPDFHDADALLPFVGEFMGGSAPIPVLQITQPAANALLKSADAPDLKTLQARIDETGQPSSFALSNVRGEGEVVFDRTVANVKNVVGVLPGRGQIADEYIVVGAHYDHIGMGGPMSMARGVRRIHNGADDNASGTAVLIALAESLTKSTAPRRSIVFVAFTGEEWGLLGSKQFVDHPPVPLKRIAAMLNLDMVGRVKDDTLYVGGRGTAEVFESMLQTLDDASPLNFKDIGRGGFGPSDHMSFAMYKIPVLFLFSGLHGDYHRPSDDSEKINYDGLREVTVLSQAIIEQLATIERPSYVATSDHSRYAVGRSSGGPSTGRVTLGIVPEYGSAESTGGTKISGVVPGSPAEKAGLQAGDVITGFNKRAIGNLFDLTAALGESQPGDRVVLKVKRGEAEIELHSTLARKAG